MKTKSVLNKTILAVLVAALALASFPLTNAYAAAKYDPPQPPLQDRQLSNERLERIWARELKAYERLGKLFDHNDGVVEKIQDLIDRASQNGKDVSAVQAALDAFEAALQDARPTYESLKGIVNSHQGFDDAGKVTDAEKAKETVREMGAKLKEIRDQMAGTGRALREAVRAFREANKPATTSP